MEYQISELEKTLQELYLELPVEIADDVWQKWKDVKRTLNKNAPAVKDEAIKFADWLLKNFFNNGEYWWSVKDENDDKVPTKSYTTEDVYKKWLVSVEK